VSVTGHNPVRHPDDYYATPSWCTRAILRYLPKFRRALDPCAGDGAILAEVRATYGARVEVEGIEIDKARAKAAGARCADALKVDWPNVDLVIMNPPFKLAMEFVEASLRQVVPGGTVAVLLRLAWLASQKRAAFLRANTPSVYVLPRRPSFTGRGTDSTDYAWMVWDSLSVPTVTILDA
jgi:hypothetical protein